VCLREEYAGRTDQTQAANGRHLAIGTRGGRPWRFCRHGRCLLTGGPGQTRKPVVLTAVVGIDISVTQEWSPHRMVTTACALARWHETASRQYQWTERDATVAAVAWHFKRSTSR
jgi:hypothetical protein